MLRGGEGKATASLQILAPLGAGGFGAVYEAIDLRTGQHVAVKRLDDTSADSIARFKHEFRALADCHHENLVGLRELIEQDGRWLIVMELVPGTDFLRYVRSADNLNEPGALGYDEARVRKALIGMVHGLQALHAFGIVHRDLKPSNVRVRPDGRAVLLDFGLVTSVDPKKQSTHALGVGTVIYMAPEQAGGTSVGPAADMYALGVCLFEALTGQTPFEGTHAIKIVLDKQRLPAPRAKSLVALVPHELDELCARLLAIEPDARPSPEQVLAILTRSPVRPSQAAGAFTPEPTFAGREAELAHLTRALALTNDGEQRLVLIEGESGVGKSELVSEFLRRAASTHPRFLALRGRCYENEQVSYKAFDGCIDELASHLRRLSDKECAALVPERGGLLGQLFPVLRKVPAIAQASREGSSADPTARRLEAFAAISHLLARIAEDRPLALVLDDLQWADSESFRLLHALRAQTPRAPILLVATLRPREELDVELDAQIEALRKWHETGVVTLFGLPQEQAALLARRLLGPSAPEKLVGMVVEESQGHPLFMSELVQYTQSHDFSARSSLTIDAALSARVDGLERPARELLEMVALAARPYPGIVFAAALSSDIEEIARKLLAKKLLRQRRGQELSCFHDRIRHAAVGLIARARLPMLHYKLAAALDAYAGADPSEKAQHWELAGKPELASAAYEQAAENSLGALAFTRAAELFGRALALLSRSDPRTGTLLTHRADALAWAGRSADAALLFQQAAESAQGEERIRLRSNAAMHTMISAQTGPGIQAASQLLRELGFVIPSGRLSWLVRFAWDALRLRLSPVKSAQTPSTTDQRERFEIMAAGRLLRVFAIIHPRLYFGVTMQHLRRAARSGLRAHSALAYTMRAWLRAFGGSLAEAKPLLDRAEQLMVGETNPNEVVAQAYATGSTHMVGLDWVGALPHLLRAERVAQEQCPDPWLLTVVRYHLGASWYHAGEHGNLAREAERWLAEARERKDLLGGGLVAGMGFGFVRHLMRDDPQAALDELRQTVGALPPEPFSFAHMGEMIGVALSEMYRGGSAALSYLEHHESLHARHFVQRARNAREGRAMLRAQALLCAYVAAPRSEQPALLESAKRLTRTLEHARSGYVRANVSLLKAQIEACEGRIGRALPHARDAEALLCALGHSHRHSAAYLIALLEGGVPGQRRCAQIVASLQEHGWREPLRLLTMHMPCLPLLLQQRSSIPSAHVQLLGDRYQATGELGRGGFGSVIAARDVQSGRDVALKELVRKGGSSLERFKQEFRALADIHHEHIVRLEELFEHDGAWYIAMERVDGVDLLSYVRASGRCDPERLRRAALGVVLALQALHQKGFVHRDVRPENVLVTAQGRAVLIDFGLIARIGDTRDVGAVGTVQYAAPEQLHGAPPAPEADAYALALSLYAAISGENPLAALTLAERLQSKQKSPPALSADGFAELGLLLQLMLAPNPSVRPTLVDLARVLEGAGENEDKTYASSVYAGLEESGSEELFRGREREQAQLQTIVGDAHEHSLRIVLVQGESGVGKSALVNQFARRAKGRRLPLEVFKSRCYEHERVAFKAFDGVVDQLALSLRDLPTPACEALLPRRAALLAQLFPVLSSVPAIAHAPKKGLPADPAARKQAGIEGFAQLLENIATMRELLLVIDDLQWADQESFTLLQSLARVGERLPIAILCTVRPEAELEGHAAGALASLRGSSCCRTLALGALEPAALASLAAELLGDLDLARLPQLVVESAGHPLFLRELVEQEKRGIRDTSQVTTLDAALRARIAELDRPARDVLVLAALADKPHALHVYARAIERAELPREVLIALLGQGLLQRRGDRLACYHDRIRRAVVAGLAPAERASAARRLARALNEQDRRTHGDQRSDAAERARLWDEAGELAEAVSAYEQAGDQALEGLAFARAEEHYTRALELSGDTPDESWQRLQVSRGHALVRAGRSAEAARCFQAAARYAQGDTQVRLRVWAAQHLIQSAQIDSGMQAARELLSGLGVVLPETESAAKKRIVWERARVKLRGIALRERMISAQEALVLDALHGLSAPVRAVSFLPGSALVSQYLRRALDAGDRRHAARALAFEGLWRLLRRPDKSQEQLFERSAQLAASVGDPALMAELDLTRGMAATGSSNFEQAITRLVRAHELLNSQCPGQPWLLTGVRTQLGAAWFLGCHFHELRQTAAWVEDARARDDRYALASLCGMGYASLRHALDDDPEAGLEEWRQVARGWPAEPFSTVQFGLFMVANPLISSANRGREHLTFLEQQEPRLAGSALGRSPHLRYVFQASLFHALLRRISAPDSAEAAEYLRRARAPRRAIAKVSGQHAALACYYFDAWLALLAGRREEAIKAFSAVAGGVWNPYYQVASEFVLGRLEGGDTGSERCERARTRLRSEGWRNIQRGLAPRIPVTLELCDALVGLP